MSEYSACPLHPEHHGIPHTACAWCWTIYAQGKVVIHPVELRFVGKSFAYEEGIGVYLPEQMIRGTARIHYLVGDPPEEYSEQIDWEPGLYRLKFDGLVWLVYVTYLHPTGFPEGVWWP